MVNLIASTTTRERLVVESRLDERIYETKRNVSAEERAAINIREAR